MGQGITALVGPRTVGQGRDEQVASGKGMAQAVFQGLQGIGHRLSIGWPRRTITDFARGGIPPP
jgi:hypothetical protein